MSDLRIVAYGGGVNTVALLVLAAQGEIDYQTFVFSNVGDDSESPGTLDYTRDIAAPYAREHGLELIETWRVTRDGTRETIYERINRADTKSIVIPFRGSNGAPLARDCTADFKVAVVGKWLKNHGASPRNKATVAMGIATEEVHRANPDKAAPYEILTYPLLERRMRRDDCMQVIREAGLPVPPKSACWFCPFTKPRQWADMQRRNPRQFHRAAELEQMINERQSAMDRDPVYLTRFGRPLPLAPIGADQGSLFDDNGDCDNGWCMT